MVARSTSIFIVHSVINCVLRRLCGGTIYIFIVLMKKYCMDILINSLCRYLCVSSILKERQ